MHKTHIFLILALIFLTGCGPGASTPPKPNTANIKLIGQIAASNQVNSKSDKRDFARGLEVSNHFAYIAIPICVDDTDDALRYSCNENWLRVIDMTDATQPLEIGYYQAPLNTISDIALSGNYAYITSYSIHGLTVWDISNRLKPVKVSSYERLLTKGYDSGTLSRVTIEAHNAHVTAQQCKVGSSCIYEEWILDISKPQAIQEVQARGITKAEAFGSADILDAAVTADYLYIARGNAGLSIVDKSNPAQEIGYYNTPAGVWSVAVDDKSAGLFYVADYNGSVYTLQLLPTPGQVAAHKTTVFLKKYS